MESLAYLNQVGPALSMALGAIGSAVGCYIAGIASHAAMSRVEEGHGKMIAMASACSTQCIYGLVLTFILDQRIKGGDLSPVAGIFVGLLAGLAIMYSAIYQGKVAAAGIQASLKQPAVYGKCLVAVGVLESFAIFALVFSLLII